jgi:toxin-antitoxin system PIN domain toxin
VNAATYLLDVNLLIALSSPDHLHHGRARRWFGGVESWATSPMTEAAFVRLMLNPVVAGRKRAAADVLAHLKAMRGRPGHQFWADDASFAEPSADMVGLVGHGQVTDLHLVDLAARRGGVLATFDSAIRSSLVEDDQRLVELV